MNAKIGIVICGIAQQRQFVTDTYIQAALQAGGIPFVLPLVTDHSLINRYVNFCDSFLFCGGADITPLMFGAEPLPGNGETNLSLDQFQLRLMQAILATDKPLLAICRGMQVLNVACGGTILQDLSHYEGNALNHMQRSELRSDISHSVHFSRQGLLAQFFGTSVFTNSFHHQAIHVLGDGLLCSGRSSDGIIEAIELPSHSYVVGVQWHPECMTYHDPAMKQLFAPLVSLIPL